MNIVFISPGTLPMPPVNGGAVENLIDIFLKKNEVTGEHRITVFSIYSGKSVEVAKTYKHCTFEYIKIDGLFSKIKVGLRHLINKLPNTYVGNEFITQVIKRQKKLCQFDVVIVENKVEFGLLLRKGFHGKLILHLHNDQLHTKIKLCGRILDCYDEVYTVSNFIKRRVNEIKPTNKIYTLYNGVNTNVFHKEVYKDKYYELRKQYNIREDDIVFIFTGRINASKGIKELMEAFVELPREIHTKLIVVGSAMFGETVIDPFLLELKRIAERKKDDIIFTGYVDYDCIGKVYSIADVSVVPSIGTDAATLTAPESMATGIPVIISDSGGINELINEDCGIIIKRGQNFVADLNKVMLKLSKDKDLREKMGYAARMNALKFDNKVYYKNYNNLIENNRK